MLTIQWLLSFSALLCLAVAFPTEPDFNSTEVEKREYGDGEGTYVGSDSVHHYASGVKCWTDYFTVTQNEFPGNWYPASSEVYCTDTQSCTVTKMTGQQECQTWSISVSAGIQSEFVSFSVERGHSVEECTSATDTTACTWNDGKCHIIWARPRYVGHKGYQRRRCSSKNGDYTAWMKDFTANIPLKTVDYGCGSKCSDSP